MPETEIEIERLNAAVDAFAEKMKAKLAEKAALGFTGWDAPAPEAREVLFSKFLAHVESQCNGLDEWVDLANFCMFLERLDDVGGA
jgi:hypothetical protein